MRSYDHSKIEKRWQKKWEKDELYKTPEDLSGPKSYILDMFPYPSGEGLHVGHPKGYIATDIYSRYKKMAGHNILHPMGWDAFGLPAENFAIKNNVHPRKAVEKNIARFKEQLGQIGFNYDWDREINTTDPQYYKWTQWIFLQLYKKGLAYESDEPINWCPQCQTGLANEDLEGNECERCGSIVEKKPMRQWMLKITDYADRLLDDLEELNWPESIKESQRNWIGRSAGAEISFKIQDTSNPSTMQAGTGHSKQQANSSTQIQNSKQHVVLVRGCLDSKEDNDNVHWLPWIEERLTESGVRAERPIMPTPWEPRYGEWKEEFEKLHVDKNSILIGHSCGCAFLTRWLGETGQKVKKLILVAPWKVAGETELYDFEIDESVKENVGEIVMFTSNNEERDGKESLEIYKNVLGGRIVDLKNRGHYVEEDMGTIEFPELLDEILTTNHNIRHTTYNIPIFTTRPDTLFGATYLVLSPEHRLVTELLANQGSGITNHKEVEEYVENTKKKTEVDRTAEGREKTGVKLEGVTAINPASKEEIPVFIADYVLAHYGTGAIMAVPAHDERDFAFAQKYDIPIRHVVVPQVIDTVNAPREDKKTVTRRNVHAIVYDPKKNAYLALRSRKHDWDTVVIGGVEEGENIVDAAKREVREETGYTDLQFQCTLGGPVQASYFAKHKDENRLSVTEALYFTLQSEESVEPEEDDVGEVIWVSPEDFVHGKMINSELPHWLLRLPRKGACPYTGEGVLMNSGKFDGLESGEVREKITEFVGGEMKTTYKLRDWVFSRQRYWGEPIPIIHCEKCGVVPVPEEDLPVTLPEVEHYQPTGTGESPLAAIEEWVNTTCPKCGGAGRRETNTMPQWAGSSWYYLRYCDPKNNTELASKEKTDYWLGGASPSEASGEGGVDMYVGGAEHATRHLIYARFWHKFLYDIGVVNYTEPFKRLQHVGLIAAEDGRKMSKRYGNVINPDDVIENYGADTLRVYEMFMGPFDQGVAWSTESIIGPRRFLERVWRLESKVESQKSKVEKDELEPTLHKTIKKVTEDIETFDFNTAISAMMVCLNEAEKVGIGKNQYKMFLKLLAPFAPHITEELWTSTGETTSIHVAPWPEYDPQKIKEDTVTIAVQINGKVRGEFEAPANIGEGEAKAQAQKLESIQKWIADKKIERVIYVPERLVNIVISG